MAGTEGGCNVHNDGVCAMHGVEVERRNQTDRKTDVLPAMLTKINFMFGYACLATILICGGFYYTAEGRAEAVNRDMQLREAIVTVDSKTVEKIDKITDNVASLTTAMAKSEARHEALIGRVDSMMEYMKLLINTKHPDAEVKDPGHGSMN